MTYKTLHIGISGPIAVGKTTLAHNLKKNLVATGLEVELYAFATGIREIVAYESSTMRVLLMFNLLQKWGYDSTRAHLASIQIDEAMTLYPSTHGIKNRRLLQLIGTEIGRNSIAEDIWIQRAKDYIRENTSFLDYVISDDVRFNNEAMAVDIHIALIPDQCYEERKKMFDSTYLFNNHASEQSLTMPPLLTLPACYASEEFVQILQQIQQIRQWRI